MPDTFNVGGNQFNGPAAFGSGARAEQHNGSAAAAVELLRREVAEIQRLLVAHLDEVDDPDAARHEVALVSQEIAKPAPDPGVMLPWLDRLIRRVNSVSALSDAVWRVYDNVQHHWPR
jgi:hypothetical protein